MIGSVHAMVDSQGCTLLHYLALTRFEVLDQLASDILHNIDLKQLDYFHNSALHYACMWKNEPMIFNVLQTEVGLQIMNTMNYNSKTPGEYLEHESSACRCLFIASGADLEVDAQYQHQQQSSIGVLVLGDSEVGKTTLINTLEAVLKQEDSQSQNSVPTVGIETKEIIHNGHTYTFYDFAGQPEFETSHSLRLENLLSLAAESPSSHPFVFLLLVKSTDSSEVNKSQINKWFYFIRRHVKINNKGIYLALICSHDDCFKSKTVRAYRSTELKEHLRNLDTSVLKLSIYENPILLNGLLPDTTPLKSLLDYLNDMFLSSKPVVLKPACHELLSFLESSFPDPCQIKDVVEKIRNSRKFTLNCRLIHVEGTNTTITHEKGRLVYLLKQLHAQNHIVLLMPSDNQLDGWIISKDKQDILFNKLIGIFSPVGPRFKNAPKFPCITHQTGIVPAQELFEIFESLSLGRDLLENYLTCMEFCFIIEDKDVLDLFVSNSEIDQGKCLFFPGLIRDDQKEIPSKPTGLYYSSMWVLDNHESKFVSRFLHMLLFQMMKFVSQRGKFICKRKLSLWRHGMFWRTTNGVDVLFEVIGHDHTLVALFQSIPDKSIQLAQHRHEVLSKIREVLSEYRNHDNIPLCANEYFVHPPATDFNEYTSFLAESSNRIPVDNLYECFKDEPESNSRYIKHGSDKISLEKLLGFDSYIPLRRSTLKLLGKNDEASIEETFHSLSREHLEEILKFHFTAKDWIDENPKSPVFEFIKKLNEYSIFEYHANVMPNFK